MVDVFVQTEDNTNQTNKGRFGRHPRSLRAWHGIKATKGTWEILQIPRKRYVPTSIKAREFKRFVGSHMGHSTDEAE
jgi:hypothetical protein